MLGLVLALVAVAGLAVDLGHAFSERRALAAAADAAALAGCNALDETWYRSTGEVRLDPAEAERRARRSLATQLDAAAIRGVRVVADSASVRVELDGVADLTLLRLFGGLTSLPVRIRAEAFPRVVP
jgi:hypothetical protein